MRKRLFFIVKQLNLMGSAELVAVSFASHLCQEYDVFLYSIEQIAGGKINQGYDINPRVIIRSLNLPHDEDEQKEYLKENGDKIASLLTVSSRNEDVFILFSDRLIDHIQGDVNKILIKGFSRTRRYNSFDRVVFLTKKEFMEEIAYDKNLYKKSNVITPFSSYPQVEDYKFHGNKIMCITRADKKYDYTPLFELAKGLKKDGLKFSISICVEGNDLLSLEENIFDSNLDDVIKLNSMKEIKNLYNESDLFFYFSKNKHYPLFLIESITSSIPVISLSENEYAKDIISNVGINVSTISEAIEKILRLLKDKIKLAKLKFETFEYAKRFVKDNALKEFKKIIEGLLIKHE